MGSGLDTVASRILSEARFKEDLALLEGAVLHEAAGVRESAAGPDLAAQRRLVESAALMALSDDRTCLEMAYRVSTLLARLTEGDVSMAAVCHFILSRLGNFPSAVLLADRVKEEEEALEGLLPAGLWMEAHGRRTENAISYLSERLLLTDFQRDLWQALSG